MRPTPPSSLASGSSHAPVMTMVRAVIVQMTMVSMNGSSSETNPSVEGSFVFTAECAIDAEPMPASLENAARWNPTMRTPTMPPDTPSGENAPETIKVIIEELRKTADEPVGDDELAKAKEFRVGNFRLSLETPMALAQRAGEALLTMGEIEPVDEVVAKLEAVTPADLQKVAGDTFRSDNIAVSVVGPGVAEEEIGQLLAA